jgi:outer membrane protein assembly factor BamA
VNSHRSLRFNAWLLALALSFLSATVAAQTRKSAAKTAPAGMRLTSIKVTGAQRFPVQDVVAATALEIGQAVTEDDFRRITQRLGETGAFSDVAYSFQFTGAEAKLELKVVESEQFVPARFENFVWLTGEELTARLHSVLPLFHGELPISGNLPDEVSAELQAMLSQRNVPGRANYLRAGPEDGPTEAFVYRVAETNIRIRNLTFSGAGPTELEALESAADRLQGEEYSVSTLAELAEKNLLPIFLARGFLRASVGQGKPKVVQQTADQTDVDVSFSVEAGRRYMLAALEFAGGKAIPPDEIRGLVHLKSGEPANAVRLERDIQAINKLYGTHGYMDITIRPVPILDEAAGTVTYRLQIHEGEQYHMGELDIRGLDSKATARLQAAWKLHEGDAYDSSYPDRFVEEAKGLLAGDWDIDVHQTPEPKDKIVDVTLRFDRKS